MLPPNPNEALEFKAENLRTIYLAGGCFWGTDAYMARVYGVAITESGYANGHTDAPVTYETVCTGTTGTVETVKVVYDITKITLAHLLEQFFSITDLTTLNQQANDVGTQYRSGIYYIEDGDVHIIEAMLAREQQNLSRKIVTEIMPLKNYQAAEVYHQNYLEKNPDGYCHVVF